MSTTIVSIEISDEQGLTLLRHVTRRASRLLGFPTRSQAEISAAAAMVASAALRQVGHLSAGLLIEDAEEAGVFLVAERFDGKWPPPEAESGVGGGANKCVAGLVDLFRVEAGPGKETTVTVGKGLPPDIPVLTGEAIAGMALDLDRGSGCEQDGHRGPSSRITPANGLLRSGLEERSPGGADTGIQSLVEAIREDLRRSRTLIGDLLSLADAGVPPADVCDVDVSLVVSRVLEDRASSIEERGAAVSVDDGMGSLAANPGHLYQLFASLLDCALAVSDPARPVVEVRRLENGEGGAPCYLVRGSGPGVRAVWLDDGTLPPLPEERSAGFLSNLATAGRITRLYNGGLSVYDDGGTCFRFFLGNAYEPGFERL